MKESVIQWTKNIQTCPWLKRKNEKKKVNYLKDLARAAQGKQPSAFQICKEKEIQFLQCANAYLLQRLCEEAGVNGTQEKEATSLEYWKSP